MNLGQSQFQDTFFVAGAQLTPYRQLRQIELELRQIEDALKRGSINQRRTELKIAELDPSKPKQALDLEEAQWDLEQQKQLVADAEARKQNFLRLKEELLARVPQWYWDAGFEAAECEHWVQYLSKQLSVSQILGAPDRNAMEQLLLLPPEAQDQVMINVAQRTHALQLRNQQVLQLVGVTPEGASPPAELPSA